MRSKSGFRKFHLRVLFFLFPLAGLLNTILPFIGALVFNKLAWQKGIKGNVSRIKLSPLGKTIRITGITIEVVKDTTGAHKRLFSADSIQVILDRNALIKGFLIFDLVLDNPSIIYSKDMKLPAIPSAGITIEVPVVCNHLILSNGSVRYVDTTFNPVLDLHLEKLNVVGRTLSNIPDPKKELQAEITVNAELYDGVLNATLKADLTALQPKFDLNAEIKHVHLEQLNDFFRAYGQFDVNKGTLSLFAEAASKEKKFKGYVKPEIFDLDFLGPEDRHKGFLNKLWQAMLGATLQLFENQKKGEVATKIPFSGTFEDPKIGVWMAGIEIIANAFIKALQPSIDYEIDIHSPGKK